VSGDRAPTVAVSAAGTIAIEPAPNPAGTRLAWVGVFCTAPYRATLWVTDLVTGARINLGSFSGDRNDDGLSWDATGTRLAVESGRGLAIVKPANPDAFAHADRLGPPSGCTLADPVYRPGTNQLAAIQTCNATKSSIAVTLDSSTGRHLSQIVSAPPGSRFVSLSVDRSGQHFLLGVQFQQPVGVVVQAENGQLVTLSRSAPTGDEW
jgi:hypothetical protein